MKSRDGDRRRADIVLCDGARASSRRRDDHHDSDGSCAASAEAMNALRSFHVSLTLQDVQLNCQLYESGGDTEQYDCCGDGEELTDQSALK